MNGPNQVSCGNRLRPVLLESLQRMSVNIRLGKLLAFAVPLGRRGPLCLVWADNIYWAVAVPSFRSRVSTARAALALKVMPNRLSKAIAVQVCMVSIRVSAYYLIRTWLELSGQISVKFSDICKRPYKKRAVGNSCLIEALSIQNRHILECISRQMAVTSLYAILTQTKNNLLKTVNKKCSCRLT